MSKKEQVSRQEEMIVTTAYCLAFRGYLAEHPGDEDRADRYAMDHLEQYLEDAWAWLVDQGERIKKEREKNLP